MAVFSQGIDQISGDNDKDIRMIYDYIKYMVGEIDRAHSDSVQASAEISKAMSLAVKEMSAHG